MKKLWFVRRKYGWGWTPATWQGWAVLGVYSGGVISIALRVNNASTTEQMVRDFFLPIGMLTTALLIITLITGEKTKWSWGDDDEKK